MSTFYFKRFGDGSDQLTAIDTRMSAELIECGHYNEFVAFVQSAERTADPYGFDVTDAYSVLEQHSRLIVADYDRFSFSFDMTVTVSEYEIPNR